MTKRILAAIGAALLAGTIVSSVLVSSSPPSWAQANPNLHGAVRASTVIANSLELTPTVPQPFQDKHGGLFIDGLTNNLEYRRPSGGTEAVTTAGTVTLTGDVTGLANNNTITKVNGILFSGAAPSANQALAYNGSQLTYISFYPLTGGTLNGTITFGAGLGAVAQITGPVDQQLLIEAANTHSTTIDATGGGQVNIGPSGNVSLGGAAHTVTTFGALIWSGASGSTASLTAAGSGSITLSAAAATAGAGVRNAATRNIVRDSSVIPPDCSGGTLNLTVTQFLDSGIATCGTAQTINFPTWQGGSGIVQGAPGSPVVGDVVEFDVVASAGSALTVGAGMGGTIGGSSTVPANSNHIFRCRLTSVTANSETATCY